jgi:Transposase
MGGEQEVITIGIDPHKRSHTAAAADAATGELVDTLTVTADPRGHARLIEWARATAHERRFALEDCRPVSGRLERELVARGERVVRVPPKLMGQARRGQRGAGKSDPIDALAVARAALREPELPVAHLDREAREAISLAAVSSAHPGSGEGAARRVCHTDRTRWRLRQRSASRVDLPSARLRSR